jgi:hypothetical protein
MSHEDRRLDAPTSAASDSIILHVPACVQRFSSRRRMLSRLRALARRRDRGLPELEAGPLKLQVEENPNWPPADEQPLIGPAIECPDWSEEGGIGFDFREDRAVTSASAVSPAGAAQPPAADVAHEERQDPNDALIQQLLEDNQDLKAALCRLIRIAEENEAALRLLEEENQELSGLVHRLTIGQTKAVPLAAADAGPRVRPWRAPVPGMVWLKRRWARRCI